MACIIEVLSFHYSLRDREPEGKAPEGTEDRKSEDRKIWCTVIAVFLPEASGKKIAGSKQCNGWVPTRKTVTETSLLPATVLR